ncbi:hypothetical protein [Litchfieldia salsa]|uniref:Uncharacterized protein n=1 Tax=Litchfieldia salsa TaxID=930152 RepID=A0A1H0Q5P7_9BACI|nr:hypothetical protein [Litchfieldia salsa]SDP12747.1 hypothetical protein SAMN05216565_101617 [Litchfieldia salsa]
MDKKKERGRKEPDLVSLNMGEDKEVLEISSTGYGLESTKVEKFESRTKE